MRNVSFIINIKQSTIQIVGQKDAKRSQICGKVNCNSKIIILIESTLNKMWGKINVCFFLLIRRFLWKSLKKWVVEIFYKTVYNWYWLLLLLLKEKVWLQCFGMWKEWKRVLVLVNVRLLRLLIFAPEDDRGKHGMR